MAITVKWPMYNGKFSSRTARYIVSQDVPSKGGFRYMLKWSLFFFHGRSVGGGFKSQLTPAVTDTDISLPGFNPETNLWTLQSR
jgi:hypothetical protein